MSAIQQNTLIHHRSDEQGQRHSQNPLQQEINSTQNTNSGTVNISFSAHMRLRAYQDQRLQLSSEPVVAETGLSRQNIEKNQLVSTDPQYMSASAKALNSLNSSSDDAIEKTIAYSNTGEFPEHIKTILSEVESNIVQSSEPGYQYLVNMLTNYQTSVEDPLQLQEIMRKEEFYLSRRKPFMESDEFHSYSQVLSQFSNIIDRQQSVNSLHLNS